MGGSDIPEGEGPCVDCNRFRTHMPGCSLDDKSRSLWSGSEIEAEDAPCEDCGGVYCHAKGCPEDPENKVKRQSNWSLAVAELEICNICFAKGGHRITCPTRIEHPTALIRTKCEQCGQTLTPAHTDRMCLIRQATNRIKDEKEIGIPCEVCAGVLAHHWPCTANGYIAES